LNWGWIPRIADGEKIGGEILQFLESLMKL